MNIYQGLEESYNKLKEVLENLLDEHLISIGDDPQSKYPLIVLETSTDSVGFAVVNGTPKEAYTTAYQEFKKIYRLKHSVWQHRNLSFVICRFEPHRRDDGFFSSIENDVYFCRKYVIHMPRENKEIVKELSRLPFLPLPEETMVGAIRPTSAQTLLQSINVSAALARQIVVPREYSAARILKDLSSEDQLLPEIKSEYPSHDVMISEPTEKTRIKGISIEAFRVYKKRINFNLDADIVILYGPNGLGKTSFFDAIDYICTGRIGRLCRRRPNQKDFIKLARNLDMGPGSGIVEMEITRDSSDFHLLRTIEDWRYTRVGKEKYDRANLLQFITSAQWETRKPRIEIIERLFRASHLFNQTDPDLFTDFF